MANDDNDRDPEIQPMTREEALIFEHDMDIFVTMFETDSRDYAATERLVNERRREDRQIESEWDKQ